MPYRTAIIGKLELTEIDREGPIPAFVGEIQGRKLIVRFDIGAISKLCGKVGQNEAVARTMIHHEAEIKSAAQSLLGSGFWKETGEGIEILLTALDI